jgi:hypothetical protein
MATLTVETIVSAGTELIAAANAAAGGGDDFTNDGRTALFVYNTDSSSVTMTIVTSQTIDGLAIADKTVVVAQNEYFIIPPLPTSLYGTTVSLTYSGVTAFFVLPFKFA